MNKKHGIHLLAILCGLSGLLLSGCQSKTMKGTPFYTGEYAGSQEGLTDRVNLWPLLYYRDPALSVCWPFYEFTDDHTALRPVFSVYDKASPKPIYNVLWPVARFDTGKQSNRIFPVYWGRGSSWLGEEYFVVAPLYWHLEDPFKKDGVNALFPLWIWSAGDDGRALHLLWPVFADKQGRDERLWRIWPLYGYDSRGNGADVSRFWAWPLGGSTKNAKVDEHHLFPLYYVGNKGTRHDAWSLLGGRSSSPEKNRWAVFPALSWGETARTDSKNYYLLGLAGSHQTPEENGSYLVPFYARQQQKDSSYFLSLPYCTANASNGSSWQATFPFFYHRAAASGDDLLLTPLYSRKKDATNNLLWRCYFPLLYVNETYDAHFMTLLGGRWKEGDHGGWLAVPILSGGVKDAESSTDLWLGGLAGRMQGTNGTSHYVLPLYYAGSSNSVFLSLPYMRWQDADSTRHHAVPLLLSGTSRKGDSQKTLLLGGLASWETQGDRTDRSMILPFYGWKRGEYLYTLPYGKNQTTTYFMTPLVGRYLDSQGGWVFPFWHHEADETEKKTNLLLGALWHHSQTEECNRHSIALTLGYHSSDSKRRDPSDSALTREQRKRGALLLYWDKENQLAGPDGALLEEHSSSGFFPLWSQRTEMPRRGDKTTETSSLLLRLYDYRQETPRSGNEKTYTRHRVLWRLYHKETLGSDTSTDIFPSITIDRKENGFRKYSFLWRAYRYERNPETGTTEIDVFFIPIKR